MPLTYGSLFSGIGGFDLGFDRAGLSCKFQVELDEYCNRILEQHWPDVRRHKDAKTFPPAGWDISVDVLAGGDPCQRNSGAGANSTAESLGAEFLRIVEVIQPRIVVRENPSHIRRDAPWPWWRFRAGLERLGYACVPFRLRSCCVGAFHQRDRLFVLGVRADSNGKRLEGREAMPTQRQHAESAGFLSAENWLALYGPRGIASRAGLSDYVAAVRAAGNAVCPHVTEKIGLMLVRHFGPEPLAESHQCQYCTATNTARYGTEWLCRGCADDAR